MKQKITNSSQNPYGTIDDLKADLSLITEGKTTHITAAKGSQISAYKQIEITSKTKDGGIYYTIQGMGELPEDKKEIFVSDTKGSKVRDITHFMQDGEIIRRDTPDFIKISTKKQDVRIDENKLAETRKFIADVSQLVKERQIADIIIDDVKSIATQTDKRGALVFRSADEIVAEMNSDDHIFLLAHKLTANGHQTVDDGFVRRFLNLSRGDLIEEINQAREQINFGHEAIKLGSLNSVKTVKIASELSQQCQLNGELDFILRKEDQSVADVVTNIRRKNFEPKKVSQTIKKLEPRGFVSEDLDHIVEELQKTVVDNLEREVEKFKPVLVDNIDVDMVKDLAVKIKDTLDQSIESSYVISKVRELTPKFYFVFNPDQRNNTADIRRDTEISTAYQKLQKIESFKEAAVAVDEFSLEQKKQVTHVFDVVLQKNKEQLMDSLIERDVMQIMSQSKFNISSKANNQMRAQEIYDFATTKFQTRSIAASHADIVSCVTRIVSESQFMGEERKKQVLENIAKNGQRGNIETVQKDSVDQIQKGIYQYKKNRSNARSLIDALSASIGDHHMTPIQLSELLVDTLVGQKNRWDFLTAESLNNFKKDTSYLVRNISNDEIREGVRQTISIAMTQARQQVLDDNIGAVIRGSKSVGLTIGDKTTSRTRKLESKKDLLARGVRDSGLSDLTQEELMDGISRISGYAFDEKVCQRISGEITLKNFQRNESLNDIRYLGHHIEEGVDEKFGNRLCEKILKATRDNIEDKAIIEMVKVTIPRNIEIDQVLNNYSKLLNSYSKTLVHEMQPELDNIRNILSVALAQKKNQENQSSQSSVDTVIANDVSLSYKPRKIQNFVEVTQKRNVTPLKFNKMDNVMAHQTQKDHDIFSHVKPYETSIAQQGSLSQQETISQEKLLQMQQELIMQKQSIVNVDKRYSLTAQEARQQDHINANPNL